MGTRELRVFKRMHFGATSSRSADIRAAWRHALHEHRPWPGVDCASQASDFERRRWEPAPCHDAECVWRLLARACISLAVRMSGCGCDSRLFILSRRALACRWA